MVNHKNLQETCNYTAAFLQNCQTQGDLRWTFLDACLKVLQNTDDLDRFLPHDGPRVQYVASDSVLTLRNKERGPFRHWETLWEENQQIWSKHISKSHFAVRDSGLVMDVHAGLQSILSQNDPAGGDPNAFSDHISFLSMMNEKRGDAQPTFTMVRDALSGYSPGTVIFFGPGDADMWWPNDVGSAANATWQRRSF